MHVSDALISSSVALTTGIAAITLIAVATKKIKQRDDSSIIPLMGVMGAFVFAAQMINFSIPGTGSSGHLIGGILLSAVLGPWCAFITLCSILIVQCLVFADGGLLALGCNILNMAVTSCLIAYPLVFRPLTSGNFSPFKITLASVVGSVVALEIGAFAVTLETELSGITALPFKTFVSFMLPIHLVIGTIEGIVTASLLVFVAKTRPSILEGLPSPASKENFVKKNSPVLLAFLGLTLLFAIGFSVMASQNPDGLEWAIENVAPQGLEDPGITSPTAFMPDYESNFAGIVGAVIMMSLLWAISTLIFRGKKLRKQPVQTEVTNESEQSPFNS